MGYWIMGWEGKMVGFGSIRGDLMSIMIHRAGVLRKGVGRFCGNGFDFLLVN